MAEPPADSGDVLVEQLARKPPGEKSWNAITRKRRLVELLKEQLRSETPTAVIEARQARVTTAELMKDWKVSAAWLSTIAPVRPTKDPETP